MSHRYQTLISPFVLPNGVVLKNRMVHPKCAPDQTQGPEDWPTAQTAFFYSDAARRGNALVMMHVRNSPDVRKMPDCRIYVMAYYPVVKTDEPFCPPNAAQPRTLDGVRLANRLVENLAAELGLDFLNVNRVISDPDGYLRKELAKDPVHMWPCTYREILNALLPYLA